MLNSKANRIVLLMALCALLLFAAGCQSVPPLSDSFDEATVKQTARDVVSLINAQDSDGLRAACDQTLAIALTDDKLTEIYTAISAGGAFSEFGDAIAFGATDKTTGAEYGVVVLQAKYESKTLTYTLSFDTEMKLAGLYYK